MVKFNAQKVCSNHDLSINLTEVFLLPKLNQSGFTFELVESLVCPIQMLICICTRHRGA